MSGDSTASGRELNEIWERRVLEAGADFVRFVDLSGFPREITGSCTRAVLFGRALSKEYVEDMRAGVKPRHSEFANAERRMDALALKLSEWLEEAGYESLCKFKIGLMPHKTVALRAGLGFIGKNNLLVSDSYGCAVALGKVLTNAPFEAASSEVRQPLCGGCTACVDVCPTGALLGTTWSIDKTRDEILTRKLCSLCLKCMMACPHTAQYAK